MNDSVESVLQKLAEEIGLMQQLGADRGLQYRQHKIEEKLRSALEPTLAEQKALYDDMYDQFVAEHKRADEAQADRDKWKRYGETEYGIEKIFRADVDRLFAENEKLRELLRRCLDVEQGARLIAKCNTPSKLEKAIEQALSPSPTPAQASCCNRQTCKLSGDVIPPLGTAATTGKGEQG